MSRKKGLSQDEKRQRMQQVFFESEDVFTLKEIEKIASKEKGIVLQSVKDVLDGLVSDNLVNTDKVGITNVFWQFPSQSLLVRQNKLAKSQAELAKVKADIEAAKIRQKTSGTGRDDTPERREKLAKLAELRQRKEHLGKDLATFAASDPKVIASMKE